MIKIQKFNIQDHKIKCLIYGESWSWKTVFGSTAPNPFWLSAEWGLASVIHTSPIGVAIKTLKDLKDTYQYIKNEDYIKDKIKVDTVIIDSISEINEIIKDEIKIKKGGREFDGKDWGKVQDEIKTILRQFRDLDKHIIFISLAKEMKDEEKIDKIVPLLNGQAARDIAAYMDLVCFIGIDKTGERFIITKGDYKYLTKDRFNQFPIWIEPNFTVMQSYIENITISQNEILGSFESEEDKIIALVNQKATTEQVKKIITTWNIFWKLSMEKYPDEVDSKKQLKYTHEKNELMRRATMKAVVGIDDITHLSSDQAILFIERLEEKLNSLREVKENISKDWIEWNSPENIINTINWEWGVIKDSKEKTTTQKSKKKA